MLLRIHFYEEKQSLKDIVLNLSLYNNQSILEWRPKRKQYFNIWNDFYTLNDTAKKMTLKCGSSSVTSF